MGSYIKPQINQIPFRFGTGGYSKPDFSNIPFNFRTRPSYAQTGDMKATISAFGIYQDTTYTYLKYCERYIVGYSQYGIQILKGKCYYGGIRDFGANIVGAESFVISDQKDLPIFIKGTLRGPPQNILAYLKVFQRGETNLSMLVRGLTWGDFPVSINLIPPSNLNMFLKVWPQKYLLAQIYGWQESDLSLSIYIKQKYDLQMAVSVHPIENLYAKIKGWGREVPVDLNMFLRGMTYENLSAIIRSTYIENLPAYIGTIQPQNLNMALYGWQQLDLSVALNGVYGDNDLRMFLNISGAFFNLCASIKSVIATDVIGNLKASVYGFVQRDFGATIKAIAIPNLGAYINPLGQASNLMASIYPKVIRLTGIINVSTMEHKNLYAVINAPCGASANRNLYAYIRTIFKKDLNVIIAGKRVIETLSNLGVKIGITNKYLAVDKLPLNVFISSDFYKVVDKLPLFFQNFSTFTGFGASITGILTSTNLGVSIVADYLDFCGFDNTKSKEVVRNLTYNQIQRSFEIVEFSFKSIVDDIFFSSYDRKIYKMDKLDKWVLEAKSFIPQNTKLNIKRKLHRIKQIYNLTAFNNIDEAMRFAVEYVTANPMKDIRNSISATGGYINMANYIFTKRAKINNLNMQILGV